MRARLPHDPGISAAASIGNPVSSPDAVDMLVGILSRAGDYWRLGGANAPDFQAFLALPAFDKHLLSLHQNAEP